MATCLHCQARGVVFRRGLCGPCYRSPAVRSGYAPRVNRVPWDGSNPAGTLPAEPTAAAPGTDDKLAVLEARAAAGLALHHPGDATVRQVARGWVS